LTSFTITPGTHPLVEELILTNNQIISFETLSQSIFPQLTDLEISQNSLSILDVSNMPMLVNLNCNTNSITSLDVSVNASLDMVNASNNSLTAFTAVGNTSLTNLNLKHNDLTMLDLSSNLNLGTVDASDNNLTIFTAEGNTGLVNLNLRNNQFTTLSFTNVQNLTELDCSFNSNLDVLNVTGLLNLEKLYCDYNNLNALDLASNINLTQLSCSNNNLSELDVGSNANLRSLTCSANNMSFIDVTNLSLLNTISCEDNNYTSLDFSQNTSLTGVYAGGPELIYLNIRNVARIRRTNTCCEGWYSCTFAFYIDTSPNLAYICVDQSEASIVNSIIGNAGIEDVSVSTYCPYYPGTEFYAVEGENKIDTNADGCDANDYLYPNLKYNLSNGVESDTYISNDTGTFSIPLFGGSHAITPILENTTYFAITPSSIIVDFPTDLSVLEQDFCITPLGDYNDLEVLVVPIDEAIPGFDSEYKIIYKNIGTTALSGDLSFNFNSSNDYVTYLTSNPLATSNINNILSWDYIDLLPFEEREIDTSFNLNTPTDPSFPLNSGDQLSFSVVVNSGQIDETPQNNVFDLNQTVVNSFDPNDIRCLEGEHILPEHVGEYVHYIIRFENLGTANARNVVIEDYIDETKFDVSSLVPLDGSHSYYTRIDNNDLVRFIFEDINLPFDDANNDGYVVFKIKTLDTLVLGDEFANQAEIYFDFNAPIITNNYTTEVAEDNLSISDFDQIEFRLYPNPASNSIKIISNSTIEQISILDINGRLMKKMVINEQKPQYAIDVENLTYGIYFLQIQSNTSRKTSKFVKD
jgi:Leucine-rich repeat (LRR) protein